MAVVLLILGMAGPRWGYVSREENATGREIVLLIDVSRSMGAEDAIPSRLGAAVLTAKTLIRSLPTRPADRVAVVAFSGRGELICPMTENLGAVLETLESLEIGTQAAPGTDLGDGLHAALEVFNGDEPNKGRLLLVFTDGEDHAGSWPGLLDRVRASRAKIHSVLVGDAEPGATIPVVRGSNVENLRYQGEIVRSKRDDTAMRRLRDASGGLMTVIGRQAEDLSEKIPGWTQPSRGERSARDSAYPARPLYGVFIIAALTMIVLALRKPSRRSIGLLFLLLTTVGFGPPEDSPRTAMMLGERAYKSGDYAAALAAFDLALRSQPDMWLPEYNRAATLFQLGRYEDAAEAYRKVRDRAPLSLQPKVDFALGNIAVMQGQYQEALALYDRCLSASDPGGLGTALKRDAKANRDFASTLIPPPLTPDPQDKPKGPPPRSPGGTNPPKESQPKGRAGEKQGSSEPPNANGQATKPPAQSGTTEETEKSPDQRLNAMLNAVKKRQSARKQDRTTQQPASDNLKDW